MSSAAAGSPACHRRAPFGDDTQGRHWLTRMHAHSLFMICAEQMIRNTLGLAGGCASSKNTVVTFASAFLAAACAAALRFASAQRAVTFGRGTMRMMDPDSKEPACSSGVLTMLPSFSCWTIVYITVEIDLRPSRTHVSPSAVVACHAAKSDRHASGFLAGNAACRT